MTPTFEGIPLHHGRHPSTGPTWQLGSLLRALRAPESRVLLVRVQSERVAIGLPGLLLICERVSDLSEEHLRRVQRLMTWHANRGDFTAEELADAMAATESEPVPPWLGGEA